VNCRLAAINGIQTDKGVNLKVSKVEVDVDGVETEEEVDESFPLGFWNMFEQGGRDDGAGGEGAVDWDGENEGFGINVADFYSSFVCEEDRVAFAGGVNADIVFRVRRVGEERLDNKVIKSTGDRFDLCDIKMVRSYAI
jgi:hypothetical protein